MLFGAKCHKCGCVSTVPCNSCNEAGQDLLPATLTAKFSEMPSLVESRSFVTVSVTESCMGSGATGAALSPLVYEGDPGGPLGDIVVTSPGVNYARFGRFAPELYLYSLHPNGSGAGIVGQYSQPTKNACGCDDLWALESVTIIAPGENYFDLQEVRVLPTLGYADPYAEGRVRVQKNIPTLTATTPYSTGVGAEFTIAYSQVQFTNALGLKDKAWKVSGVSVTNGGSGYADTTEVVFDLGEDNVSIYGGGAIARTARAEPTVQLSCPSLTGTGLQLRAEFAQTTLPSGDTVWELRGDTVVIEQEGEDYEVDQIVEATLIDGEVQQFYTEFSGRISSVSATGAVLEIAHTQIGTYFKNTGVINRVEQVSDGLWYSTNGEITEILLTVPGSYYAEDPALPPCVATTTVGIGQTTGIGDGSGAVVVAVIDEDTSSPTFGQVTGFSVEEGGDGYIARLWIVWHCCAGLWEGEPFVLERGTTAGATNCVYSTVFCDFYHMGGITFGFNGIGGTAAVSWYGTGFQSSVQWVMRGGSFLVCNGTATYLDGLTNQPKPLENCMTSAITLTEQSTGATVTLSPGGTPNPNRVKHRALDYASMTIRAKGYTRTASLENPQPSPFTQLQSEFRTLDMYVWLNTLMSDPPLPDGRIPTPRVYAFLQIVHICPCYYQLVAAFNFQGFDVRPNTAPSPGWPSGFTWGRLVAWLAECSSPPNVWPTLSDFQSPTAINPLHMTAHTMYRPHYLGWDFGLMEDEVNLLLPFSEQGSYFQYYWPLWQARGLVYPYETEQALAPAIDADWNIGWN